MKRCAVAHRDDVVDDAVPRVDAPMGGIDLRESGALCGRAIADELQLVPGARAVAIKVGDDVAITLGKVEHEGIVAATAGQGVDAGRAIEYVVAHIADDHVVQAVAGSVDRTCRRLQHEVFDIRRQCIADRCEDSVDALAGILGDHISEVVDIVGVVAGPADQGVGTATANQ